MLNLFARLILWIGIALVGYWIYDLINHDIVAKNNKERIENLRREKMEKIREVLLLYKDEKGKFPNNWDQAINFAKTGNITSIKVVGDLRDSLVETKTDTTLIPVRDSVFKDNKFSIDSLAYLPEPQKEGEKYKKFILTSDKIDYRGTPLYVFEIRDPNPLDSDPALVMGDLSKSTYDINR